MTMRIPDPNRISVRTLYYEALGRMRQQGARSYDEYIDLVEELLQQKLSDGELDKHDDLPQIQKDLEMLWPDIEQELSAER